MGVNAEYMGDFTQQARLQVECMAITVWVEILSWIASSSAVLLVRQRASTSWAQMVSSSFARYQKASKSWSHELIGDRVMNSHEVVICIARQCRPLAKDGNFFSSCVMCMSILLSGSLSCSG